MPVLKSPHWLKIERIDYRLLSQGSHKDDHSTHTWDEARCPKQLRRRCERRYWQTDLQTDRHAYLSATRDSFRKSPVDRIRTEHNSMKYLATQTPPDEQQRDYYSTTTWRRRVYTCDTFCQLFEFADKVTRIHDNILETLRTSTRQVFTVRLHFQSKSSASQPVNWEWGSRLLCACMPAKSSPLDVLLCGAVYSKYVSTCSHRS